MSDWHLFDESVPRNTPLEMHRAGAATGHDTTTGTVSADGKVHTASGFFVVTPHGTVLSFMPTHWRPIIPLSGTE